MTNAANIPARTKTAGAATPTTAKVAAKTAQPPPKDPNIQKSNPSKALAAGLKPRTTGLKPCAIMFQSGQYQGLELDLGGAIVTTDQDQSADWKSQQGMSLRVAKNFSNVSTAVFKLTLEFWSPSDDISEWTENCKCLQEIDPDTGQAPTLLYVEGSIRVSPCFCSSVRIKKEYPFDGGKGFHYGKVDVTLEVLGGKTSEHRFAPPFVETELTRLKKSKTKKERQKEGVAAVAESQLAKCLSAGDNQKMGEMIKEEKFSDVEAVRSLAKTSPSGLLQAATSGLIPKEVLAKIDTELRTAIAIEIARKQDGVSGSNKQVQAALASAVLGQASALPADLQSQVPALRDAQQAIYSAVSQQQLDSNSPVFTRGEIAEQLIRVASCGLNMRNSGAVKVNGSNMPPEQKAFFDSKLKDQSGNKQARDKLVLEEINKSLGKDVTDAQLQTRFGLASPEQAKSLRNGKPYKSQEAFVKQFGATSGISGHAAWDTFIGFAASSSSTPSF